MRLFFRTRTPNPTRLDPRIPKLPKDLNSPSEQLFGMWRSSKKEAQKNPQTLQRSGGFPRIIYRIIATYA